MLDPTSLDKLDAELREQMRLDKRVLDELCNEIRPLRPETRRIQARSTTAISLVGTDGGNNQIPFDPFLVQVVRIVDSSRNEYCLEVVTPTTDIAALNARHFSANGTPLTALGELMEYLGKEGLWEIAPTIPKPPNLPDPSWLQVYRELTEWAVLFKLVRRKDFGTDTIVVMDGLLRSKVFAKGLFKRMREGLEEGIATQLEKSRRRIYLAGVAKKSRVLQRYRLAMALEGVMRHAYPCFVEVPVSIEQKSYEWKEYARGSTASEDFNAGAMFLVKFGSRPYDPVWPVDLFLSQLEEAPAVLGYLLADAVDGFPIPFYPQCLQRAHENAALVDFDFDVLQDRIIDAIRSQLGDKSEKLDELVLVDVDPSGRRYR